MNSNVNIFYLTSFDVNNTIFVRTGSWIIWTLFVVSLNGNIEFFLNSKLIESSILSIIKLTLNQSYELHKSYISTQHKIKVIPQDLCKQPFLHNVHIESDEKRIFHGRDLS